MSGKLRPRDMAAALATLESARTNQLAREQARVPKTQTACQRGQLEKAFLAQRDVLLPPEPSPQFKGLMALLAGCELALVDLGVGLSMHSPSAKDCNMQKAKAALEAALGDFRRGVAL